MKRLIISFIILLAGCANEQNPSNVKQLEQTIEKQQSAIEQLQEKINSFKRKRAIKNRGKANFFFSFICCVRRCDGVKK